MMLLWEKESNSHPHMYGFQHVNPIRLIRAKLTYFVRSFSMGLGLKECLVLLSLFFFFFWGVGGWEVQEKIYFKIIPI